MRRRLPPAALGVQGRGSTMLELAVLDPPRQDWHLDVEVHVQSAGAPTWQRRRASARLTLPAEQPRPG